MPVVGIIAEYNPLHAGHAYHIESAKSITGATACVCVLSSSFVQRGEPAVISKWARTDMALKAGADLVLELPSAFSCASAEYFAAGAVKILDSLDMVDFLCFGSEEGNLESLEKAADILAFETDEFKLLLKEALDRGFSFAVARQTAMEQIGSGNQTADGDKTGKLMDKPNNILGIEYIKAIKRTGSKIKPVTLERRGQGYNSQEMDFSFSSATAIRKYLSGATAEIAFEDDFLRGNLPKTSLDILSREFKAGRAPVLPEAFEETWLHLLRTTPKEVLKRLPYMGEGLENRLKQAAMDSVSYRDLVSRSVTSRYPASRIKRILCALMTGMTGEFLEELKVNGYAQYIRVLGFSETGRRLLSVLRKNARLPVITKPSSFARLSSPLARKLFEHEIRATDAYVLGYPGKSERRGGTEYTNSPLYLQA